LDAARKKVSFLRHVVRSLRLERIEALHARVEALHDDPAQRGRYDVIVSRAFASMPDLLHAAAPLIRPGGRVVALKGLLTEAELAQLRAECLAGEFGAVLQVTSSDYQLPGLRSRRMRLVAVREGGESYKAGRLGS
jgi:16S rRNA (guanine527-N7)-methyltransferase